MIDHTKEHLLSYAQAAKRLPKRGDGKQVHPNTVARWARDGICNVYLETIRIGTRCFTSVEACQRFFAELTTASRPPRHNSADTPSSSALAAMSSLERAGV